MDRNGSRRGIGTPPSKWPSPKEFMRRPAIAEPGERMVKQARGVATPNGVPIARPQTRMPKRVHG